MFLKYHAALVCCTEIQRSPHTPQCESTLCTIDSKYSSGTNLMFHSNVLTIMKNYILAHYCGPVTNINNSGRIALECNLCGIRLVVFSTVLLVIFVSSLNRSLCHWGKNEKVPSLKLSWQIFFPLQRQRLSEPGKPAERRTVTCSTNSVTPLHNLLSHFSGDAATFP